MNNLIHKLARPIDRGKFSWAVFLSLYPIISMADYNHSEPHMFYTISLILVIVWVVLWSIATIGRLADLEWNRWLALALIVPWCAFIWEISRMNKRTFGIALIVLIVVQLPLMLVPGKTRIIVNEKAEHRQP